MRGFNVLLSVLLLLTTTSATVEHLKSKTNKSWIISRNSSLTIRGKTSINTFQCDVKQYMKADTLVLSEKITGGIDFSPNEMVVNVNAFDCAHNAITNDFKKTMKASDYPQLSIRFLNLDKSPGMVCTDERISGDINISLGGITKNIRMEYLMTRNANGALFINGQQTFCLSDFCLVAPEKLMGLIKVGDNVEVSFLLNVKEI